MAAVTSMGKTGIISTALTIVLSFNLYGRLGENELICGQRYGPHLTDKLTLKENERNPLLPNALTRTYQLNDWRLKIAFLSRYGAAKMVYSKKPGKSIQKDEVEAILKANTPDGQTWKMVEIGNPNSLSKGIYKALEVAMFQNSFFGGGIFERTDGSIASWNKMPSGGSVTIQTKDVAAFEAQQKAKADKSKIPAF